MPAAVTTPAGSRRLSTPPSSAPTGSATSSRTSTSAAESCESGIHGDAGEDRDVHQGRDQRRADEEADHQRAPRRGRGAARPAGPAGAGWCGCATRTAPRRPTEPARNHGPAGEKTATSGSAVANARITPARATRRAASRRAGRCGGRPRASGAGRRSGCVGRQAPGDQSEHQHQRASPSGDSQRDSPTTGTKASPSVTPAGQHRRLEQHQRERQRGEPGQPGADQVGSRRARPPGTSAVTRPAADADGGSAAARTRPTARLSAKIACHGAKASTTAPYSGPEHAAQLLHRAHHAERDAAALRRVHVGHQGERRRHQAATADALEEPAGDHAGQVVRRRGDQRAEGEHDQRPDEHRHPAAQVGDPADQRQHRDVAEQEPGDDRGRPLELVDGEPDPGHHVRQGQDDDVGVGGREADGDRGERQQRPGPARPEASRSGDVLVDAVLVEVDGVGRPRRRPGRTARSAPTSVEPGRSRRW